MRIKNGLHIVIGTANMIYLLEMENKLRFLLLVTIQHILKILNLKKIKNKEDIILDDKEVNYYISRLSKK